LARLPKKLIVRVEQTDIEEPKQHFLSLGSTKITLWPTDRRLVFGIGKMQWEGLAEERSLSGEIAQPKAGGIQVSLEQRLQDGHDSSTLSCGVQKGYRQADCSFNVFKLPDALT